MKSGDGPFVLLSNWARNVCRARAVRSRARLLPAKLQRPKRVDGPWHPDGGGLRALMRALSDPDASVRLGALEIIAGFSAEHATPLVTGAIHDLDPEVRCAAVRAAARLGVPAVIPALIVATEDPEPVVREMSADAIGALVAQLFDPPDAPALPAQDAATLKDWWRRMRLRELLATDN